MVAVKAGLRPVTYRSWPENDSQLKIPMSEALGSAGGLRSFWTDTFRRRFLGWVTSCRNASVWIRFRRRRYLIPKIRLEKSWLERLRSVRRSGIGGIKKL